MRSARAGDPRSCERSLRTDAQGVGRRSLQLLHDIEETLSSLRVDCEIMNGFTRLNHELADRLKTAAREGHLGTIDESGEIADTLRQAAGSAARVHERFRRRCVSARADRRLDPDDGVEEEFESAIAAAADFHDSLEDLAYTIELLDAELESPTGQAFATAEELLEALRH